MLKIRVLSIAADTDGFANGSDLDKGTPEMGRREDAQEAKEEDEDLASADWEPSASEEEL